MFQVEDIAAQSQSYVFVTSDGGGKKVFFFVEIFLNKTAKSSHKREDIIRGLKIIEKLTNDTIFKRYPYNVDF